MGEVKEMARRVRFASPVISTCVAATDRSTTSVAQPVEETAGPAWSSCLPVLFLISVCAGGRCAGVLRISLDWPSTDSGASKAARQTIVWHQPTHRARGAV